ncbi:MAG: CoA pyrophosphatase [Bacteroidota bacterium]
MNLEWIHRLEVRLGQELPGLSAQLEMAPPARGKGALATPPTARTSAVLALMYPLEQEMQMVFMRRAEDGRTHGGQISFAGGKTEEEDETPVHTALREAEEELGISQQEVKILGQLTELYIPVSNFLVYPSVGFLPERPTFNPDPVEVAGVIETPLSDFLKAENRRLSNIAISNNMGRFNIEAPAFEVGGHTIWGATAMMLSELVAIVQELD